MEGIKTSCVHKEVTVYPEVKNNMHNPKHIFYLYNQVCLSNLWPPKALDT